MRKSRALTPEVALVGGKGDQVQIESPGKGRGVRKEEEPEELGGGLWAQLNSINNRQLKVKYACFLVIDITKILFVFDPKSLLHSAFILGHQDVNRP